MIIAPSFYSGLLRNNVQFDIFYSEIISYEDSLQGVFRFLCSPLVLNGKLINQDLVLMGSSHYSDSHNSDSYFSDTHNSDSHYSNTH